MTEEIKSILTRIAGSEAFTVEPTPDQKFGHYASNIAMRLAGKAGKAPIEVAKDLREKIIAIDQGKTFEKIEIAPPGFLNFWFSKSVLRREFARMVRTGKKWGKPVMSQKSLVKSRQVVVIDYSHPNIAKPMSVAHMRSTIIGAALVNIFKWSGWKVIGDNHLGDWGKQFGVLIAAYKQQQGKSDKRQGTISIDDLLKLYVDYSARMKADSALEEVTRRETKLLQDGNRDNVKIWKAFYKVSLAEFKKIYKILGVRFDYYLGESYYKAMLPGIISDALDKGVAVKSEGAIVIPIEGKAPFVIQKSDEAFLYATTDLAAAKYRAERFKPSLVLYVVDNGQSLHFEQLFGAVAKLGYGKGERLVHVKFGLILSEDMKKLSTRAGRHISLEGVISEAIEKAAKVVHEKRPDLSIRERVKIARAVGIAALKFNDLSQNRQSDIAFRWESMLSFEGQSAPYIMYTYTRLRSILRKAKVPSKWNPEAVESEGDFALVLLLARFPEALEKARSTFFPHYLAEYLVALARGVNRFYETEPVLTADAPVKAARLRLIEAAGTTLCNGMKLLGITPLERM
ncbi:MAG: arginine--tRNA ligase [Patescibacteria group bacterium]